MDEEKNKTAKRHLTLIALGVVGGLILLSILSSFYF